MGMAGRAASRGDNQREGAGLLFPRGKGLCSSFSTHHSRSQESPSFPMKERRFRFFMSAPLEVLRTVHGGYPLNGGEREGGR